MNRLLYAGGAIVLLACAIVIAATSTALPATVATHFNATGHANGYMGHLQYEWFMLGLGVGLPLLLFALLALIPAVAPQFINMPDLRVQLTGPRRAEVQRSLAARGAVLAMLLAMFLTVVHVLVVTANRPVPPQLDGVPFVSALIVFLVATGIWAFALAKYAHRA